MNTFPTFPERCKKASSIRLRAYIHLLAALFLVICLPAISVTALAQTQLGADINGEAAGDQSGRSVSLSYDGRRLAVGAPYNSDNGQDSGHVRVYQWSDTSWEQLGADIDGEAAGDFSGNVSLSWDGNRMAIGAESNDGNGTNSGHVRVYYWSGTSWQQLGADIDGEAAEDDSGTTVSLSSDGDRLAIGAANNDGNGAKSGHARVYHWSGTSWEQLGVDIDGETAGDRSNIVSLSPNGEQLAIGSIFNDGNGTDSGHVRVYQWSGTSWEQLGDDIDGEAAGDRSGYAVSLSSNGDRVAIGAPRNDGNGTDAGHVRVYQWSGADWVQLGEDIDGEAEIDWFGMRLSLSSDGNRLAVGTGDNDGNGGESGHARIFHWSGTHWQQLGDDIDGEAALDYAAEVSLSADGNRLAFGARWNDGNGLNSGHVRVYDLSMFNVFKINPGLNDAWYFPDTDGQGFFITVFPELGAVSLAWFTYDTELPPVGAVANLGDPGHRWITAIGPIDGNQVLMDITLTSGGIFDTPGGIIRTDPPGADGTILLTFDDCNSATVEYDITSINKQGIIPIVRIANDNIVICEALKLN